MRGHSAGNMNADGRDLALFWHWCLRRALPAFGPHAGQSCDSLGRNAEIPAGADQDFFEPAHVLDHSQGLAAAVFRGKSPQIKNGIPDDLPRSVERHIAAAVGLEYLNSPSFQLLRRSQHVFLFRISPKRNDRRVFKQQQHVTDAAILAKVDQLFLEFKPNRVVEPAELENGNHGRRLPTILVQKPRTQRSRRRGIGSGGMPSLWALLTML